MANEADEQGKRYVGSKEMETVVGTLRDRLRSEIARTVRHELPFIAAEVANKVGVSVGETVEAYLAEIFGPQ